MYEKEKKGEHVFLKRKGNKEMKKNKKVGKVKSSHTRVFFI